MDIETIQKKTGFQLEIAPDVCETEAPTTEEVRLLRDEIDPLGIRELERMSGGQRRRRLREIIRLETDARASQQRSL